MSDYEVENETADQELQEEYQEALTELDRVMEVMQAERQQCVQDRRFATISGAMWEDQPGQQFENLPRPEVNKIRLSTNRILNDYRQYRVTVNFVPSDGSESDVSETLNGLFRADENDSNGQLAYLNAFDEKLNGGIGAWRLRACYEDEGDPENDYQRIRIEPIYDADTSVYFDLDAKAQDKSDATRCWVLKSVTPEWLEEEYGVVGGSINKPFTNTYFDWFTADVVYVAEYYKREEYKKRLIKFKNQLNDQEITIEKSELEDRIEELTALGFVEVSRRTIKDYRVRKMLICGSQILEDYGYIAGKYIPIIVDYGQRWFVDNVERCMGHVRLAKDVTRLGNMVMSKLAQIASQSATSVPILTADMIGSFSKMWSEANINTPPYMLINPLVDQNGNDYIPQFQYTQTPQIPPAIVALYEMVEKHLMDVLGNQQEGEKLRANTSDKAIELVQTRIDQQTYVYFDNHCIAMKWCGTVWLSMAQDLYIEAGRKMKTIDDKDMRESIVLKQPTMIDGTQTLMNDLENIKMEVVVDVGQAYASRKEKTVSNLTKLLPVIAQTDPQQAGLITSTIMMNMDGEGVGDLREFNRRKLVAAGIVEPTEDEKEEMAQAMQNQQPDAQSSYLLAAAQEASAKAQLSQVNAAKAVAEAKKTEVETAKIVADMDSQEQADTLKAIEAIMKVNGANGNSSV